MPAGRAPAVAGLLLAAAVGASACGTAEPPRSGGPATSPPAALFVRVDGSDDEGCRSPAAACRTLAHAYLRARPGEVIEVGAGTFGPQELPAIPGRGGPAVEIRAAARTTPRLARLGVLASHVRIVGLAPRELSIDSAAAPDQPVIRAVQLQDVQARTLWVRRVSGLRVRGGSFGDVADTPPVQIAGAPTSRDISFDDVRFHDARATRADVHTECIWAAGVDRLTIRRSRFDRCSYFGVFVTRYQGANPRDLRIEGSTFGPTTDWRGHPQPFAVNVANWVTELDGLLLKHNRMEGDVALQPASVRNARMEGNIGRFGSCHTDVDYVRNASTMRTCGPTDRLR
jgi:hypothetical protein